MMLALLLVPSETSVVGVREAAEPKFTNPKELPMSMLPFEILIVVGVGLVLLIVIGLGLVLFRLGRRPDSANRQMQGASRSGQSQAQPSSMKDLTAGGVQARASSRAGEGQNPALDAMRRNQEEAAKRNRDYAIATQQKAAQEAQRRAQEAHQRAMKAHQDAHQRAQDTARKAANFARTGRWSKY
jgi:hypothetical protein